MGRHSQSSVGLGSTLTDLGAAVASSLHRAPATGRRVAAPAKVTVPPSVYRAGGVAAAVSLAISSVAYAAVQNEGGQQSFDTRARAALDLNGLDAASTEQGAQAQTVNFTLVVDGVTTQATTRAASWGKALVGAGVSVDGNAGDTVSVPLTEAPTEGATVTVHHVSTSTQTADTTEAHGTVEKQTDTLIKGEKKVETAGVDGVTRTTHQVKTLGGQEVGREAVSSTQVTNKVDEVVLVGTGTPQDVAVAQAGDGTSPASAKAIAKAMLSSYGWGESEYSCLVSLWNRESTWNYTATNPSSGAYGIPQSLPASKMASAGADWQTNPATQIKWGLGYIQGRYGSPCGAWAHSEATGWY